jgi:hypothetical protein
MSGFTSCTNISIYLLILFYYFKESASLFVYESNFRIFYGGSWSPHLGKQSPLHPSSTISLELNTQTKTLHFFVDDTQLSHCITYIYTTPLSFCISSFYTSSSCSVEIISFLLLKKASVDNNIKCTEYKWGTGYYDTHKY